MGYETKLIFVTCSDKKWTGYMHNEAEFDMGKCCYGAIADLFERYKKSETFRKKLIALIKRRDKEHNKIYDSEGNYTPEVSAMSHEERDKFEKPYWNCIREIEKMAPSFYGLDGNIKNFIDQYGDVLVIVPLDELKKAIQEENAKMIASVDGSHYDAPGYRRFVMAIKIIETFQHDFKEEVRVVLWGD